MEGEVEFDLPVSVPLKLRITEEEFTEALNDPESEEFQQLADEYADAVSLHETKLYTIIPSVTDQALKTSGAATTTQCARLLRRWLLPSCYTIEGRCSAHIKN